jgi:hypothetical protein
MFSDKAAKTSGRVVMWSLAARFFRTSIANEDVRCAPKKLVITQKNDDRSVLVIKAIKS